MKRAELNEYVNQLLGVERMRDYAPNGLQVEGRAEIRRIVTGVTASLALLEEAVALRADAVLVHHGYFWKNEDPRVLGPKRRRLGLLLAHDINLFAWHLPLDAHPVLGNNAQLAGLLDLVPEGQAGEQGLIWHGRPATPITLDALTRRLQDKLDRTPQVIGDPSRPLARVAWCTGGAQNYLQTAVDLGVDAYITGEISEPAVHLSRETGVAFLAAGHHATERYGIQALGEHLARECHLDHVFVDISSPA